MRVARQPRERKGGRKVGFRRLAEGFADPFSVMTVFHMGIDEYQSGVAICCANQPVC
jgi:hypothetical protein